MTENKAVVFGLDGACLELIDPWIEDGTLSTLARLRDRGGATQMESCTPATTPPAWTTMTTGVNPGTHGIFGFYSRQKGTYDIRPVSDRDVHARRLWDYTSEAGKRSLVVNVPVTHPARSLEGVLVPGFLAHNTPSTYPETLLSDLGMETYTVYADAEGEDAPTAQLLEEWLTITRSRADLTQALVERYEWDLLFLQFQKTDSAVHKFDDKEKIRRIYECVDECTADVLASTDGDPNVFVVSDHGIGQQKEWAVALNTWLADEGWLETTNTRDATKTDWRARTSDSDATTDADSNTETGLLTQYGLTKQSIERALSAVGLYDIARRLAPKTLKNSLGTEHVDRANSLAFYEGMGFSGVDIGVILNDERFYPQGRLGETEYEMRREELIAALEDLEGPVGNPFEEVQPRETVYDGPRSEYAPDIILTQADDYVIGSTQPRGQTFIPTEGRRIDHTRHGLLMAAGPDIEDDWSLSATPHIADITPTLLTLLECPLSESFDGIPRTGLLTREREPEVKSYRPYEPPTHEGDDEDREEMRDRLRGLGYLE